jgi:hypothetical protein
MVYSAEVSIYIVLTEAHRCFFTDLWKVNNGHNENKEIKEAKRKKGHKERIMKHRRGIWM